MPGIEGGVVEYYPEGMERTNMGWLIDPDGLYELLLRLSKDAPGLPLYITENGCAAEDYVNPDGAGQRPRAGQVPAPAPGRPCARAVRDGASLAGYYVWSLLDNFEWAYGYQKRFGIVYVDFATQPPDPEGKRRLLRAGGQRERGPAAARRLAGANGPQCRALRWVPSIRARALATSAARPESALAAPARQAPADPRVGKHVPGQAAVQALDLAKPPDQAHAVAARAAGRARRARPDNSPGR